MKNLRHFLSLMFFLLVPFTIMAQEDITDQYLQNADLSSFGEGWDYDFYTDWNTGADVPVVEFYHTWGANPGADIGYARDFHFTQTITLPAGDYRIAVSAFYREGNGNGTNTKAYIFAGDKQQYVYGLSAQEQADVSGRTGKYVGASDLLRAANAFSQGDFSNAFDFSLTTEQEITLGFRGYIDTYCSWCILGPVKLYKYSLENYLEDYRAKVTEANAKGWKVFQYDAEAQDWVEMSGEVAPTGVAIDATNFPDENFRAWLLEQDYGQDALLTEEEIEGITAMDFSGNYIVYPIGIYYFRALTDVLCSKAYLRSLDISKNSQLHSLDCSHNYLDSLDVSLNSLLHYLDCSHNYLDSLDVSLNSQLHYLVCDTNYLESLDVSKNNLLHYLDCSHNYLKSLDVSKNSLLEKIVCSQNGQLTSLKISSNSLLSYLRCDGTQLQGVAMDEIIDNLPYNESGSLIVDVDKITSEQIQAARLKGWTVYRINSVGIEVLIDRNDFIYAVGEESNGSTIQTLYSPNGIIYQGFCYIDGKFKFCSDGTGNWEGEQWAAADEEGNLTAEDAANKYCPDPGTGFYHVSVDLNAMSYQLEPINSISIVVSQSTEMDEVYMSYNKDLGCWEAVLTVPSRERIKFRGNQNMEWGGSLDNLMLDGRFIPLMQVGSYLIRLYLSYDGNHKATVTPVVSGIAIDATNFPDDNFRAWLLSQDYGQDALLTEEEIEGITVINVSERGIADLTGIELFTNLTWLSCGGNQLTSLDLSKNVELQRLYCFNNQLTSLDVSNNVKLLRLYCYNNQIKDTAMDELISSLPTVASGNLRAMNPLESGEGNKITPAQVAAANAKGWKVFKYQYGHDWVEMSGEEPPAGIAIDATNFPDDNFRAWLLRQDYGQDGVLTEEEIQAVTEIDVHQIGISVLKGIEFFTALTTLECSRNQLTSLDVSKNTTLTTLECSRNQLTSLDVTNNVALQWLYCSSNQLTYLDVSKNTALQDLNCSENQLTSLDVSLNTALVGLYCDNNQLTSLDVSKNTALQDLSCSENQLTSLDVSKNTALVILYCSNNQLTSLDVTTNTTLTTLTCDNNQLTSLDVTNNVALEFLNCEANKLTSLDVSYNTALVRLLCGHNQLTSLDVTKNVALTLLFCYNNQLKSLDVTNNVALTVLSIICNQISGTEMDKLVSSLPSIDSGALYAIDYTQEEGNVVTPKQVSAANARGWKVIRWDAETERYVEMSGEDPDGIQSTDKGQLTVDDAVIYNLSGQRLSKPQRGVNIINGKKMVVK